MSDYSVSILSGAEFDIEQTIEWYDDQRLGLGFEFYQKFQAATQLLAKNPFLYQEHYLFIRRASLNRFPFSVYYAVDEIDFVIEIIAVLHQKMSASELRHRINLE